MSVNKPTAADDLYCPPTTIEVDFDIEGLGEAIAEAIAELGDINVTVQSTPVLRDYCLNGCDQISVCFIKGPDGAMIPVGYLSDDGFTKSDTIPEGAQLGVCDLIRRCVQVLTPGSGDNEGYFTCKLGEFEVVMAGDGTIKPRSWTQNGGLTPIDSPIEGLTEGVDYVLAPCGVNIGGPPATTQIVGVPLDGNTKPLVDGVMDGTAPLILENVCSVTVKASVDPDCEVEDQAVAVTTVGVDGNEYTEYVQPGCEATFCGNGEAVTIDGAGSVTGVIGTEVPIEEEEC